MVLHAIHSEEIRTHMFIFLVFSISCVNFTYPDNLACLYSLLSFLYLYVRIIHLSKYIKNTCEKRFFTIRASAHSLSRLLSGLMGVRMLIQSTCSRYRHRVRYRTMYNSSELCQSMSQKMKKVRTRSKINIFLNGPCF